MKIKDFYTDASKWTKNAFGRDEKGISVSLDDVDKAQSCCLYGALHRCYLDQKERLHALSKLMCFLKDRDLESLTHFNDHHDRKFEEVKALVEELDI